MKWTLDEPRLGDIIRVRVGSIYHLGIYVSDSEVIQFGRAPGRHSVPTKEIEVLKTSLDEFAGNGFVEREEPDKRERRQRHSPEKTVALARERLGMRGYDVINNNCEHFVNECAYGKSVSEQIESAKDDFKRKFSLDVYVSKIPSDADKIKIKNRQRKRELKGIAPELKAEKAYAWALLERALKDSYGLDIDKIKLKRQKNGKWETPYCYLSISRSNGIVAVAVSKESVGVDIEKIDKARFERISPQALLTDGELTKYENMLTIDTLNKLWCLKEAIYKNSCDGAFNPKMIDTGCSPPCALRHLSLGEDEYYLAVSGKMVSIMRLFLDGEIKSTTEKL